MLEIGPAQFAAARIADRARGLEARRERQAEARAELHAARAGFIDHADALYMDGAAAAEADCDRLEVLADELASAVERLRPTLDCESAWNFDPLTGVIGM